MIDRQTIETALQEISRSHADRRVNVFEVALAGLENDTLRLRGRVLEEANRQALLDGLSERFPGLRVDTQELILARREPPQMRWVATNLTSVHDSPSFLAEQITQMLNGRAVEVLWEEDRWGFVRQPDGYLGWTYLPYLTETAAPEATHLVTAPVGLLREEPHERAGLVTRVLGGTSVCVVEQSGGWARLALAGDWQGWLPLGDLRSLAQLPVGLPERRAQLIDDAFRLIGVPYLWGGCSAHGIDCSGFAQLLHRWLGITIPRDADMQCAAGRPVEPPYETGDLLFFGEPGEKRRITHVAVSLGGWRIIHSSRNRNGVQVDDVQAVDYLRDSHLCAASYLRG